MVCNFYLLINNLIAIRPLPLFSNVLVAYKLPRSQNDSGLAEEGSASNKCDEAWIIRHFVVALIGV